MKSITRTGDWSDPVVRLEMAPSRWAGGFSAAAAVIASLGLVLPLVSAGYAIAVGPGLLVFGTAFPDTAVRLLLALVLTAAVAGVLWYRAIVGLTFQQTVVFAGGGALIQRRGLLGERVSMVPVDGRTRLASVVVATLDGPRPEIHLVAEGLAGPIPLAIGAIGGDEFDAIQHRFGRRLQTARETTAADAEINYPIAA